MSEIIIWRTILVGRGHRFESHLSLFWNFQRIDKSDTTVFNKDSLKVKNNLEQMLSIFMKNLNFS